MSITRGLKRNATLTPDRVATVYGARRTTWRQLADRVARAAAGFRALGLKPGERIAILALNSDRYAEVMFAAAWAGALVVPLNIRLAPPELLFQLEDSGAELLVVDEAFLPMMPALAKAKGLRRVIQLDAATPADRAVAYEGLVEAAQAVADARCAGDELAGIFYTGGTTGRARGVMLTHDNLVVDALCAARTVRLREDSVFLQVAPMFHLVSVSAIQQSVLAGCTQVILPRFDPKAALEAIAEHRVTATGGVPTMFQMMLALVEAAPGTYDVSSLEIVIYGGAPMPEAVVTRLLQQFPKTRFYGGYGSTELSAIVTLLPPEYHVTSGPTAGKLRSAGRPIHHVLVRIADGDDRDVPPGAVGQILVQGPGTMKGYWKLPEESAATLLGGWMHTGDAGYLDEEGFLFIVDRVKDMIVSGGENVYSVEVENAIAKHPAVAMCAVIGIPSAEWGEAVHAVVIPREGARPTAAELAAHCRTLVANYKVPRSWDIRAEPLPLSGAGKVLKRELRAPFWKGKDRQVN